MFRAAGSAMPRQRKKILQTPLRKIVTLKRMLYTKALSATPVMTPWLRQVRCESSTLAGSDDDSGYQSKCVGPPSRSEEECSPKSHGGVSSPAVVCVESYFKPVSHLHEGLIKSLLPNSRAATLADVGRIYSVISRAALLADKLPKSMLSADIAESTALARTMALISLAAKFDTDALIKKTTFTRLSKLAKCSPKAFIEIECKVCNAIGGADLLRESPTGEAFVRVA